MITQFRVQNYKALRDVTLDLTPVHVLIGPNDSGKTSLLEALAALCRSVTHPLSTAFLGSWTGTELVSVGAGEVVCMEVDCNDPLPLNYRLRIEFHRGDKTVRILEEQISRGADVATFESNIDQTGLCSNQTATLAEDVKPDEITRTERRQRTLNRLVNPRVEDAIKDQISRVAFHRWDARFLALPVAADSKRKFRMEHNGFGLALCLDNLLGVDRDRFVALETKLREIFPRVNRLVLLPESAYSAPVDEPSLVPMLQYGEGKGLYVEFDNNLRIPIAQCSDGLVLVLAFLAVLHLPEPPRVLLIEEPENGIHPARLKEIIRILKQLVSEQSHTQVLMTTHSPYVLHEFTPEEVTVCVREKNGEVKTRRLSESKAVQEQMDFFSLGEIWTMEGDEALIQPATDENLDEATPAPPTEVQPAP